MSQFKLLPCITHKTFYAIDAALLIIVYIFQASILNYYIIYHSKTNVANYFWFLGDILLTGLFLYTTVTAYSYLKKQKLKREKKSEELDNDKSPPKSKKPKHFYGVLPLCYITWLCYASYLVFKICYIFKNEIINLLKPEDVFGPQLLKVSIAISTVVFILLVTAHNDAEKDSQRALAIKALCTGTAFELLDSMAFLSILVIRESHLIVSYEFENAVLVFACANYFLPTVALYQLCLSHFGQKDKTLDLNGVYNISHLLLVNIPYLAFRIYLWSGFGSDISMFVMKNVIAIVWSLKDICADLMTLHHQCKSKGTGGTPAIASTEKNDEIVELEQIS